MNVFMEHMVFIHMKQKIIKKLNHQILLKNQKANKKIIGIGETGLDFYYNHSEKKDQIELFSEHIEASKQLNLPLIIHTRSAEIDTFNIFKKIYNKF